MARSKFGLISTLTVSSILLAACGGGGGSGDSAASPSNDASISDAQLGSELDREASSQDNFVFQIQQEVVEASDEGFPDFLDTVIGGAITPFNQIDNVFFNTTVPVVYAECGQANAFYSPVDRLIVLCDELGDSALNFFSSFIQGEGTDDQRQFASDQAINTSIFVLYHEMGHALDDIRDFVVGGNFESVADAIGVVLSVQTGQPLAAIDGGFFFLSNAGVSFADEHGAGEDRSGDVLCWVVGSSELVSADFPELSTAFADAGRDCIAEYANQFQFVQQLLPNLSDVPPVVSSRRTVSQLERERLAALDRAMAEMVQR